MKGYVVVFEGDEDNGFSAFSPTLPGVVAAGRSRAETQALMIDAMAEHVALLREAGLEVPEPVEGDAGILPVA